MLLSNSVINIIAPTSGTCAGFAFAQNRSASGGETGVIAGGGDVGMGSGNFAMIADKIVVRGNGIVRVEVDDSTYSMPPSTMNKLSNVRLMR